ncbi:hypothetical protein BO86DRAFT_407277 [Aspergillus japonicus CBS 114.51]|uniref:Uncharacterized protein n=2 Tax=Aspergillus TaxID=5052 RepID=A0A2V5HMP1_ASPV1|nr:hypothetical protein BO86DRAFT_407277 [Aspergillus japonicus CBS 114.51]PYI17490.1 hypothetical protein BO99DRAFT_444687 [Aspergillus violaceofuscus CBS 115571]RAH85484.1 hypothetical protein BO86DRAFT_407277 [Aspergillus japonicus CBS 114.51]
MLFFGSGVSSPRRRSQEKAILCTILIVYALYFLFFSKSSEHAHIDTSAHDAVSKGGPYRDMRSGQAAPSASAARLSKTLDREMVVASMKTDDVSWLYQYFPEWHKSVYVVDDKKAQLTVKLNKGRESMVYLTYIIDNYDNLPDSILFIHPQRYQWHNDDPYYDGVPVLRNFQLPYLQKQGYVNLRCAWILGCPAEIHPYTDSHRDDVHVGEYFKNGFKELFPGEEVPEEVGVSCCAQFAVTSWKIRQRPKKDYERFRKWLTETKLPDDLSGRIMEYSWHMIFGKGPVHCPTAEECYCRVFGLCNLDCPTEGDCAGRYVLPPYSSLPEGWPYIGWKGQKQDPSKGLPET